MNNKTSSVTDKVNIALENSIKEYGEAVTDRWIKNAIPKINFYPTQNRELAEQINNPELAQGMFDFDIHDNNQLLGRLTVASSFTNDKTYYLLICNGHVILYQLENLTKLVPLTVSMPDELMVSLIVSGANLLVTKNGFDIENGGIPFITYKRGIRSNGFRIYSRENTGANGFDFLLEEVDHKNTFELVHFVTYSEVSEVTDPNKQYMLFRNEETGEDFVLLVEWDFSNIFSNTPNPIFTPIISYQLLTYVSNELDTFKPELQEPMVETTN